jgi:hypothetical protein
MVPGERKEILGFKGQQDSLALKVCKDSKVIQDQRAPRALRAYKVCRDQKETRAHKDQSV